MRYTLAALLLLVACSSDPSRGPDDADGGGADGGDVALHYSGEQRCGLAHRYRLEFTNEQPQHGQAGCGRLDSFDSEIAFSPNDDHPTLYAWDVDLSDVSTEAKQCYFTFPDMYRQSGEREEGASLAIHAREDTQAVPRPLAGQFFYAAGIPANDAGQASSYCESLYDVTGTPLP